MQSGKSLKDQGKSRTWLLHVGAVESFVRGRNPLKIRASLGPQAVRRMSILHGSQSLKEQGKSRTTGIAGLALGVLKSQSLKDQGKSRTSDFWMNALKHYGSQSLKDQGKSRTLDSLAFARRQSFSLRKH